MNFLRMFRYSLAIAFMAAVGLTVFLVLISLGGVGEERMEVVTPSSQAMNHVEDLVRFADLSESDFNENYRPIPPETGLFHVPKNLRPVVDFWKRVYTGVYSFQAIIHDSYDVNLVYGIVDLQDEPGVRTVNYDSLRRAARNVLKRYKGHVTYLLKGKYDAGKLTGERRRIYLILKAKGGIAKLKGADRRMRVQRGLRDSYRDSIVRSGKYLDHYRKIFREARLPEELTLLPHLESSFRFDANSYAGAVGIWQLTRGASYRIIHVNSAVDERIDPWRSAEAAARILKDNYNRLKSWPLAITAYNQGANAMRRAVLQVGSRSIDKVVNKYQSRNFGFAGRNFYCAYVATLEVVHHYERYFGHLTIDQPLPVNQHKVEKTQSLKTIAKNLGVETRDLAEMNPHLRRSGRNSTVSIPRGSFLNLPAETTANSP